MSVKPGARSRATIADFLARPIGERFHELVDGEIVEKAMPSGEHGGVQAELVADLVHGFGRGGGGRPDGRWWFATEVEIRLGDDICRPDIVGWRRDRVPERPRGAPIEIVPDWICEILSDTNPRNDLIRKKRIYHRHRVDHYWIADPSLETLTVYRWHEDGYLEVLIGERGQQVRAEPFAAIEIAIDTIFGHPASPAG